MRLQWRRWPGIAALCLLPAAACFEFKGIPDAAQLSCDSTDENACPAGMECCENRRCVRQGDCRCPDGREYCGLNDAIDCAGSRSCENGCWAPCPICTGLCDNPQYQQCRSAQFTETWFCPNEQVCLIKFGEPGSVASADCYTPPDQCSSENSRVCSCFNAPFSTVRPCFPAEICLDLHASDIPCIGCSRVPTDGGPGPQAGDGGPQDRVSSDQDAQIIVGDGPISVERGATPDVGAGLDNPSSELGTPTNDRSNTPEPRPPPASIALLNQSLLTDERNAGVGGLEPAVLGEVAGPLCYGSMGTTDAGVVCCDMSINSVAELFSGDYRCRADQVPVTECGGFGVDCVESRVNTSCTASDSCRWAWYDESDNLDCAATGPAAPCVGEEWLCPAGSAQLSQCSNCSGGDCS